ncbi:tetratricopeptide repeat protein [Candidatus Roizmanbacteria bacterium]|nr:tetratricopeptide repeat protein [Candidatus Roizmanbacteria bacterium]
MTALKSQAIQTALVGDWTNAVALNQQILVETPDDIDTLNRLAFAFLSLGKTKDAKSIYEKVLSLDMKNPIAIRNLKRLNDSKTDKTNITLNNIFIEEPGKTKVIELLNVADKKIISHLRSGETLDLRIKRNKIFAIDSENQYIGMLPDDICQRLIKFMEGGNVYEAYVRTIDNNRVCIFVRETKRMKKFRDQPSFVSTEKTKLSFKTIHEDEEAE